MPENFEKKGHSLVPLQVEEEMPVIKRGWFLIIFQKKSLILKRFQAAYTQARDDMPNALQINITSAVSIISDDKKVTFKKSYFPYSHYFIRNYIPVIIGCHFYKLLLPLY